MNSPFVRQNNFSHILKVHFYSRKVILRNFSRAEMDFLATDKIFCHGQKIFVQDNLGFVLDKNYFVHAEGQGMSRNYIVTFRKVSPIQKLLIIKVVEHALVVRI